MKRVVQHGARFFVERREELAFDSLDDRPHQGEVLLAVGSEADGVPSAVVRVATALDETALLEVVEDADELAPVEIERVGNRRLGLARLLGEQGEDAVLVEAAILLG